MEEIIKLKKVSQHYKMGDSVVYALSEVDLDIYSGELTALVGPSGSGKSTLLNVVGGLTKPTMGDVFIYDTNVKDYSENQMCLFRREHIGFIFQSFNLNPTLTALENVTMPLIFARVDSKDREKMANDALDLVGLSDRKDHKPGELSGGQQQRVSVARAIVNKPKIILCDEPTGNLDTKTGKEILELIKEMNRVNQITFIIVTHDINVANQCQRKISLQDGKIFNDERN
ncbi:ATP-binding cassette domain-containing protein [Alkalibaculum sp. M08DMB]|uniref:ATP-binding cassette domain-containing protein n=2 Tax=Alkalibaculum sporogenes TaxID=2655001 RepID=A0A6A7K6A3_9FIRM|nr:ABC transporter ATP-binding protein [Alkalibaculum sporogenes]MPW24871.1 ATP-binding cassette domain-containing protein [Alkalibaculum sporogenes]